MSGDMHLLAKLQQGYFPYPPAPAAPIANFIIGHVGFAPKPDPTFTGCQPIEPLTEQRLREIIREELRAAGVLKDER